MRRVKYTLGIMHWAQDEIRCSRAASITGIYDAEEYNSLLVIALYRATLRKFEANQGDIISKAADLGQFKDKHTWPDWELKL